MCVTYVGASREGGASEMLKAGTVLVVVCAAALVVGEAGARAAEASLDQQFAQALQSKRLDYVRVRDSIAKQGADALPYLRTRFTDRDWHVRLLAQVIAGRISEPEKYVELDNLLAQTIRGWAMTRPGVWRFLELMAEHGLDPAAASDGKIATSASGSTSAGGRRQPDYDVPFLAEVLIKAPADAGGDSPAYVDGAARAYAALLLGGTANPLATKALIETLECDPSLEVASFAAAALGFRRDRDVVEPLIKALSRQDPERQKHNYDWCASVRRNAARALGATAVGRARGPLVAALEDPDEGVRWAAIQALLCVSQPDGLEALIAALNDPSSRTRGYAVGALKKVKDPRAQEALAGALKHPDSEVRLQALWAVKEALKDPDFVVRSAAARELGKVGDPSAAEPLTAAALHTDSVSAAEALRDLKAPGTIQALSGGLKDRGPVVRRRAATALRIVGDPSAREALASALRDSDAAVRLEATWALAAIRAPEALDALVSALESTDPDVECRAADSLGGLGERRGVPSSRAVLESKEGRVRLCAVTALSRIRDPAAVEALIAATKGTDPNVRERSIYCLGFNRETGALPALVRALDDQEAAVRRAAVRALDDMGAPAALKALVSAMKHTDPNVRAGAARVFHDHPDPRAADALVGTLKDDEPDVRAAAAYALAGLRDAPSLAALRAAVQDESRDVRGYAIRSLADRHDWGSLISALKDRHTEVRRAAARAFCSGGHIGTMDPKVVDPLLDALGDGDREVRGNAASALAEITDRHFGEDATMWREWWEKHRDEYLRAWQRR